MQVAVAGYVSQFAEREVELQELPVRIENLLASKVFV